MSTLHPELHCTQHCGNSYLHIAHCTSTYLHIGGTQLRKPKTRLKCQKMGNGVTIVLHLVLYCATPAHMALCYTKLCYTCSYRQRPPCRFRDIKSLTRFSPVKIYLINVKTTNQALHSVNRLML